MEIFSIIAGAASILAFLLALHQALKAKKAAEQAEVERRKIEYAVHQAQEAMRKQTIMTVLAGLTAQELQYRAYVDGGQWNNARQVATNLAAAVRFLRTRFRRVIGLPACRSLEDVEDGASLVFELLERLSREEQEPDIAKVQRISYTIAMDMAEVQGRIHEALGR